MLRLQDAVQSEMIEQSPAYRTPRNPCGGWVRLRVGDAPYWFDTPTCTGAPALSDGLAISTHTTVPHLPALTSQPATPSQLASYRLSTAKQSA